MYRNINSVRTKLSLYVGVAIITALLAIAVVILHPSSVSAATCSAGGAFIMTVKTDNPGVTANTDFRIPTGGTGYSYRVDVDGNFNWSDTVGSWNEATARTTVSTISFPSPGTYDIAICGTFPRVYFNNGNLNGGDKDKVLRVTQWGDNQWITLAGAFHGGQNVDVTATDVPNLTAATSLTTAFSGTPSLVGNASFAAWDTSAVTNMGSMFLGATQFNQPIGSWDVSNVTNIASMFNKASSFNQPLNNWDTSSVTNMLGVFRGASQFNQPLDQWDTSSTTTMREMFAGANIDAPSATVVSIQSAPMAFNQDISSWDTSSVASMEGMFNARPAELVPYYTSAGYTSITVDDSQVYNHPFNRSLAAWDVGAVTDMRGMLSGTAVSRQNYDATLAGWSTQSLSSNVGLGATGLSYCASQQQRQAIIDTFGWTITGDTLDCQSNTPSDSVVVPGAPNAGVGPADARPQNTILLVGLLVIVGCAAVLLVLRKRY